MLSRSTGICRRGCGRLDPCVVSSRARVRQAIQQGLRKHVRRRIACYAALPIGGVWCGLPFESLPLRFGASLRLLPGGALPLPGLLGLLHGSLQGHLLWRVVVAPIPPVVAVCAWHRLSGGCSGGCSGGLGCCCLIVCVGSRLRARPSGRPRRRHLPFSESGQAESAQQ